MIRLLHSEGFSYFVTCIAAPVASGWSGCRVGFAPTGKRRLVTAHTRSCHSRLSREDTLRPVEQGSLLTLGPGGDRHDQRRNTTLALTPPKPKPLEMACSMAIGRALLDTRSTPSAAASGWTRLRVGGAIWSPRARMVNIASSPRRRADGRSPILWR